MEQTKLEELASIVCDALNNTWDAARTKEKLNQLNGEITRLAMHETGVTSADLADENLENSTRIQFFWTTNSQIRSKILIEAAQQQSQYRGLDY